MELFRETLERTLALKRQTLAAIPTKTNAVANADSSEVLCPPRLDYSVSKVVQSIQSFEAERLKKSKAAQKALKETAP
jgi:hypothetical protein